MSELDEAVTPCQKGIDDCAFLKHNALDVVSASISRIAAGNWSIGEGELLVTLLFLGLCSWSWFFGTFLIRLFTNKLNQKEDVDDVLISPAHVAAENPVVLPQPNEGEADNIQPAQEADMRASGDGWDAEDYDADYDVDNDMVVMMLEDVMDGEDEEGEIQPLDDEENLGVLHRIIMAETDEEAIGYALQGGEAEGQVNDESTGEDNQN